MKILVSSMITLAMLSSAPALADSANASLSVSHNSNQAERVSIKTYTISVDGKRRDSRSDVMDEALYEAALETEDRGYDWFRVVQRDTDRNTESVRGNSRASAGFERVPTRSCGLLGCSTSYRTEYRGGFETSNLDREETTYSVTLRYQMGTGTPSNTSDVYDARIVQNSYR